MSERGGQVTSHPTFREKLEAAVERNRSLLCVGLDPDPARIPDRFKSADEPVLAFNQFIIEQTSDLVAAYKPNIAFYEALGLDGLRALASTIQAIPRHIPVILDAKRGDVGHTAQAYASAAFEVWGADAVTVNPYLGFDALEPFLAYPGKGVFVLCVTSNPGAGEFQASGGPVEPLYLRVAQAAVRANRAGNVGLVAGATHPEQLTRLRALAPDLWFLVPGVGAQGGELEQVLGGGLDSRRSGLLINASRSVLYAQDPRAEATRLREEIEAARGAARGAPVPSLQQEIALALHRIGAIRFGEFRLHSGQLSPIYIDLRLLASYPDALALVAGAFAGILDGLRFNRIAAVPYGAMPIGSAVSLLRGWPMIYPRKEAKEYGRRRAIEGEYVAGDRVVVLDDLATTGASKLDAIGALEAEGLQVQDVVVLVDREQGATAELEAQGYRLHSVIRLTQLLDALVEQGRVSEEENARVRAFLKGK